MNLVNYTVSRGQKRYEGSNHLGNFNGCKPSLGGSTTMNPDWSASGTSGVLVVFSDKHIPMECDNGEAAYFVADVMQATDYSPFGVILENREWYADKKYRTGFSGKDRDDEINGAGNAYDFGARIYDSRLGRWLSCDRLERGFPEYSTFCYALNSPIDMLDIAGKNPVPVVYVLYVGGEIAVTALSAAVSAYLVKTFIQETQPVALAGVQQLVIGYYPREAAEWAKKQAKRNEVAKKVFEAEVAKKHAQLLKENLPDLDEQFSDKRFPGNIDPKMPGSIFVKLLAATTLISQIIQEYDSKIKQTKRQISETETKIKNLEMKERYLSDKGKQELARERANLSDLKFDLKQWEELRGEAQDALNKETALQAASQTATTPQDNTTVVKPVEQR